MQNNGMLLYPNSREGILLIYAFNNYNETLSVLETMEMDSIKTNVHQSVEREHKMSKFLTLNEGSTIVRRSPN